MALTGIGLKPQHLPEILAGAAATLDFFEVHAENCMSAGGPALRRLDRLRERWPLSVHGVGLSLGGTQPLDAAHLERLAAVVDRFEPRWVSEHLAWSSHAGVYFNDLLPLPYDAASLARTCDHVDRVQQRLRRPLLVENPSTYVEFAASTMDEAQFLAALVRRTGCGLLLDVTNAYVSAINHHRDPWALIAALPAGAVGEIHLAGFAVDRDGAGDVLLIDHHGAAIAEPVWDLYARTLATLGARPTLIERDHDVPPLHELLREAARAQAAQCAPAPQARAA